MSKGDDKRDPVVVLGIGSVSHTLGMQKALQRVGMSPVLVAAAHSPGELAATTPLGRPFTASSLNARPPLGLRPQHCVSSHERFGHKRHVEVLEAMQRYALAGNEIPVGWTLELLDLQGRRGLTDEERRHAELGRKVRDLMGHVEDGSQESVTLAQDDATRTFGVTVSVGGRRGATVHHQDLLTAVRAAHDTHVGPA
jgi:hypothetical protein